MFDIGTDLETFLPQADLMYLNQGDAARVLSTCTCVNELETSRPDSLEMAGQKTSYLKVKSRAIHKFHTNGVSGRSGGMGLTVKSYTLVTRRLRTNGCMFF